MLRVVPPKRDCSQKDVFGLCLPIAHTRKPNSVKSAVRPHGRHHQPIVRPGRQVNRPKFVVPRTRPDFPDTRPRQPSDSSSIVSDLTQFRPLREEISLEQMTPEHLMERHLINAASLYQGEGTTLGLPEDQRLLAAQNYLDSTGNSSLRIDANSSNRDLGFLVAEHEGTGKRYAATPGSRLAFNKGAFDDWFHHNRGAFTETGLEPFVREVAQNQIEARYGKAVADRLMPIADKVGSKAQEVVTGRYRNNIANKARYAAEKGFFDPNSKNFINRHLGNSKGGHDPLNYVAKALEEGHLAPDTPGVDVRPYNSMTTVKDVVQTIDYVTSKGIPVNFVRNEGDIATGLLGFKPLTDAIKARLGRGSSGRSDLYSVDTIRNYENPYFDTHLNLGGKYAEMASAGAKHFLKGRQAFEQELHHGMVETIKDGGSFTDVMKEFPEMTNPDRIGFAAQLFEEVHSHINSVQPPRDAPASRLIKKDETRLDEANKNLSEAEQNLTKARQSGDAYQTKQAEIMLQKRQAQFSEALGQQSRAEAGRGFINQPPTDLARPEMPQSVFEQYLLGRQEIQPPTSDPPRDFGQQASIDEKAADGESKVPQDNFDMGPRDNLGATAREAALGIAGDTPPGLAPKMERPQIFTDKELRMIRNRDPRALGPNRENYLAPNSNELLQHTRRQAIETHRDMSEQELLSVREQLQDLREANVMGPQDLPLANVPSGTPIDPKTLVGEAPEIQIRRKYPRQKFTFDEMPTDDVQLYTEEESKFVDTDILVDTDIRDPSEGAPLLPQIDDELAPGSKAGLGLFEPYNEAQPFERFSGDPQYPRLTEEQIRNVPEAPKPEPLTFTTEAFTSPEDVRQAFQDVPLPPGQEPPQQKARRGVKRPFEPFPEDAPAVDPTHVQPHEYTRLQERERFLERVVAESNKNLLAPENSRTNMYSSRTADQRLAHSRLNSSERQATHERSIREALSAGVDDFEAPVPGRPGGELPVTFGDEVAKNVRDQLTPEGLGGGLAAGIAAGFLEDTAEKAVFGEDGLGQGAGTQVGRSAVVGGLTGGIQDVMSKGYTTARSALRSAVAETAETAAVDGAEGAGASIAQGFGLRSALPGLAKTGATEAAETAVEGTGAAAAGGAALGLTTTIPAAAFSAALGTGTDLLAEYGLKKAGVKDVEMQKAVGESLGGAVAGASFIPAAVAMGAEYGALGGPAGIAAGALVGLAFGVGGYLFGRHQRAEAAEQAAEEKRQRRMQEYADDMALKKRRKKQRRDKDYKGYYGDLFDNYKKSGRYAGNNFEADKKSFLDYYGDGFGFVRDRYREEFDRIQGVEDLRSRQDLYNRRVEQIAARTRGGSHYADDEVTGPHVVRIRPVGGGGGTTGNPSSGPAPLSPEEQQDARDFEAREQEEQQQEQEQSSIQDSLNALRRNWG